jgi:cytochrome c-type biogenesis protein CcmH/NrfG
MRLLLGTLACCASVAVGLSQPLNPDPSEKYKDDVAANPRSSVAHFRLGEAYLLQNNFQSAANEFREALNRR